MNNKFICLLIGPKGSGKSFIGTLMEEESRDQTIHIDVSDDQVNQINQQVSEKNLVTDFSLVNENKTKEQLTDEIRQLLTEVLS